MDVGSIGRLVGMELIVPQTIMEEKKERKGGVNKTSKVGRD